MTCPAQTYSGLEKDNTSFTNWNGRISGPVNSFFTPASLPDLVNVIARATGGNHMVHVKGSGWAFENIAYSPDWMISLDNLNNPITSVTDGALNDTWAASQKAGSTVLFHIEAGASIAHVNDLLRAKMLALSTLGGSNGQALAGAISTGTHGGDIALPPLADFVMAMHLVTVGGREVWVERASQPITDDVALAAALPCPDTEILRDDNVFNAMLVGFGRFGVIYSYVLRAQPAFNLAEWTTKVSRSVLTTNLRAGIAAGTFLMPLLGVLPNPPAALNAQNIPNPHGLEVVFDTNNLGDCYVKRRWLTNNAGSQGVADSQNQLCAIGAAGVLAAASALTAIPVLGIPYGVQLAAFGTQLAANPGMTAGEMLAKVLSAAWSSGLGGSIPLITGAEFGSQYQDSTGAGKWGESDIIISGFPDQSLQNCFRADSIEPIFDAHSTQYIDFLDAVLNAAPNFKQAGYISLRWSAKSQATMSMHNVPSAHAVAIEVTSLKNLPDNATWMTTLEALATGNKGRPHWGQINNLNAAMVSALYGPALTAWTGTLAAFVGGAGIFSNAYTVQRGLEAPATATPSIFGRPATELLGAIVSEIAGLLLSYPKRAPLPRPRPLEHPVLR